MGTVSGDYADLDVSTGVIVIGGQENSLAVTRALGRLGVRVTVIGLSQCLALVSRFCSGAFEIPDGVELADFCFDILITQDIGALRGNIIFPCCDEAIKFVADNDAALRARFILEAAPAAQRLTMLDKMKTLKLAKVAGVSAPRFWEVNSDEPSPSLHEDISFPVMVKPIRSHEFTKIFGCKLFIIEYDIGELYEKLTLVRDAGVDVMIVEMIPGPDTLLSSYYTYIGDEGRPLYEFTKRIIRRYPENRGAACFHETVWLPDTREAGARFFESIEFRGIGNIEFKRDERDGSLKVIEVNARFTAAQVQVSRSGAPLEIVAYAHLSGQQPPSFLNYQQGLRYWYPMRDYQAFRALNKQGRLSFLKWLHEIVSAPSVNPYFAWDDLFPVYKATTSFVRKRFSDT